jgi:hypothetical protein
MLNRYRYSVLYGKPLQVRRFWRKGKARRFWQAQHPDIPCPW